MLEVMASENKREGGILYEMVNLVDGKGYAGKDSNPKLIDGVWKAIRPARHFAEAKRGKKDCRYLNHAIRKHGPHNFYVIHHPDWHPTGDLLNAAEKELIRVRRYFTDRAKGYNMTAGGEGMVGFSPNRKTRDKMSASHTGKKFSDAARANMSAAQKGVPKSPAHCAAISAAKKGKPGKPLSPEHRAKIGDALRGKVVSEETRAKLSAAKLGKKRDRISELRRGEKNYCFERAIALREQGKSYMSIAREIGVGNRTIYRWLKAHTTANPQTTIPV